ncbi:MAG TPA: LysE family translocator [Citreicella sp.]|jgi:threonine/homoserine/homoserine lactone efflux protein|uniref:Threonine/homoserine/homoserine lactone efflux protein n=1 Tax=Salipiger marinus TaxID=555512 RepID=A0A1G8NGN4_9RHOB|nr:LysE family translocator [Salipiger marinus]SDI79247.1 Threonine/homoserine/homoserine lactone efflux protein [Salipiger marinus]HBM59989.1 LysE family translocator [Citreicella sp.]HBS99045.1 LysE family translocator [Citreicella sp.]|tara:strand:- start:161 stop:739 length:579 start_codon:yes stop_codon:yes gene_type:complete
MIDPLYGFVFLGLFSPGPNVILLTTSGARFGLRRTLPHLFGVVLGVGITAGLTGLGIAALLKQAPALELALRIAAGLWMLWMAWGLWTAERRKKAERDRPMTLLEAALFQWINPKVWGVALAAASAYPGTAGPVWEAIRLGTAFSGINLICCLFWTSAGAMLTWLLTTPAAWRLFTRVMAVALGSFSVMVFL